MFYVEEEKYDELKNVSHFGVIIDYHSFNNQQKFLERVQEISSDLRVLDLIFKIPTSLKVLKDFPAKKIFYDDLEEEMVDNKIFYPVECNSFSQIDHAIKKDYNLILLGQNLLSAYPMLKRVKEIYPKIEFFSCANNAENGKFWIRPEGIEEYGEAIDNWILVSTPNYSETVREYQGGQTLYGTNDIIFRGLTKEDSQGITFLPKEFDLLRTRCYQKCGICCESCKRILKTANKIPSLKKEDIIKEKEILNENSK